MKRPRPTKLEYTLPHFNKEDQGALVLFFDGNQVSIEVGHAQNEDDRNGGWGWGYAQTHDKAFLATVLLDFVRVLIPEDPEALRGALLQAGLLEPLSEAMEPVKGPLGGQNQNAQSSEQDSGALRAGSSNVHKVNMNGMNEKNERKSQLLTMLIRQEVKERMLREGIPALCVWYLGSLNGCANALNNSTNATNAAKTMTKKEGFQARFDAWVTKLNPEQRELIDADTPKNGQLPDMNQL